MENNYENESSEHNTPSTDTNELYSLQITLLYSFAQRVTSLPIFRVHMKTNRRPDFTRIQSISFS